MTAIMTFLNYALLSLALMKTYLRENYPKSMPKSIEISLQNS